MQTQFSQSKNRLLVDDGDAAEGPGTEPTQQVPDQQVPDQLSGMLSVAEPFYRYF